MKRRMLMMTIRFLLKAYRLNKHLSQLLKQKHQELDCCLRNGFTVWFLAFTLNHFWEMMETFSFEFHKTLVDNLCWQEWNLVSQSIYCWSILTAVSEQKTEFLKTFPIWLIIIGPITCPSYHRRVLYFFKRRSWDQQSWNNKSKWEVIVSGESFTQRSNKDLNVTN